MTSRDPDTPFPSYPSDARRPSEPGSNEAGHDGDPLAVPSRVPSMLGEEGWVVDSSLPAASHLTGLPTALPDDGDGEVTHLPHPIPEPEEPALPRPELVGRSVTIARKEMLRERRQLMKKGGLPVIIDYDRPESRAECRGGKRPCLYVACRYHLYLDVNPRTGSIKINFPDKSVHDLEETCALDVAERGGVTLEEVGSIMNLTRERIRQVEASGLEKLRTEGRDLDSYL